MVGRKKKPKLCDKVSREDRLSQLPDALLSEILYHISTKDAVRTSVLSTRWRSLWQCVPALDLNSGSFRTFDAFVRFSDRVLDSQKKSWIRKLRLHIDDFSHAKLFITRWIEAVTTPRIQHLDVTSYYAFEIPQSLYTCKALVHLQLFNATMAYAEFVSLPCLKIMQLDDIKDPSETMVQKLISGSPVLEDLKIISQSTDDGNVLQVCSQTVKRISINLSTKVLIDAPLLVHLLLYSVTLAYVEFVSLPCLKVMYLNEVKHPSETMLQKLISGSPLLEDLKIIRYRTDNAKVLQVCSQTVKKIYIYHMSTKVVIDAPLLVDLQLYGVTLAYAEFVSLPCLKVMYLNEVKHPSETMLHKFISGSPLLEDLKIIDYSTYKARVLQIFSQTVKRIQIDQPTKVVIDAPLLQYLEIVVSSKKTFEIINLGVSAKLDIVAHGPKTFSNSVIHDILTHISRFKDLVISNRFLKDIFLYTKSGPVLQFGDLSRLDASISKCNLEILPTILESCPKLESFILTVIQEDLSMRHKKEKKEPEVMFSTVPQCLVSSLKFVEFKRPRTTGCEGETELVRYLLKNSRILEKLRLDIYCPVKAKRGFLQELHTMPRCSSACEIQCSFYKRHY